MPKTRTARPRDIDVYEKVLTQVPDLLRVAELTCIARERGMKYPIKSHDRFLKFADKKKKSVGLRGGRITLKQAETYFPLKFFPIEDENDLITKLMCSFFWGTRSHTLERDVQAGFESAKEERDAH